MASFGRVYDAVDGYQRRHRWAGFPFAVYQKYGEDNGGYLAATITYYGFFSIFPLLLVLTTGLGFVLRGHQHLYNSILHSALAQFPVVGADLKLHSLHGSAVALIIGLAGSLWAGMGVFVAAEHAMNQLWGVPYTRRPNFLKSRARALMLLVLLGGGALAATILASFASLGSGLGIGWKIASIALSTVLNFLIFWAAFHILTTHDSTWRELRGGAIAAAILYEILQTLGGYYVQHVLKNATNTYGTFALVIGLLSWIYLAAQVTLFTAEANVVAAKHLWPRSLSVVREQSPTPADETALRQRTKVEERRQDETVSADIDHAKPDVSTTSPHSSHPAD